MNAAINYLFEANLALLFALGFYFLVLRNETRFRMLRLYLLSAIVLSLLFPLVDVSFSEASPLSISRVIPSYWLPEVTVGGDFEPTTAQKHLPFGFWGYTSIVYATGLILFCLLICTQLIRLFRVIRNAKTYSIDRLRIAESDEDKPTFSFFNFIFIGKANEFSEEEKKQIILHESVHAREWHSFDILLVNVLRIAFWFNPFINSYKKIFVQLHEFEADARAVENTDVNGYCRLLARIALQSANLRLANHFNNSLTIKRIEMMRTMKTNIKKWKWAALAVALPCMFFFIACQDQVENDLISITKNSSHALIVPAKVQQRYDELKKQNPGKNYVLLELNQTASEKLTELKAKYGTPQHIEVFNTSAKSALRPSQKELEVLSLTPQSGYSEITLDESESAMAGETFAIIEFTDQASRVSEAAAQEDQVYTVVEQQPEFPGGYDSLRNFIRKNLRYPLSARQQGIEGTVYASFIVDKDGKVYSVNIIRGLSPDCDSEVKRLVESSPDWVPGKQSGRPVSVRFVLPIKFSI